MSYSRILTVTQVTTYIKSLFEGDRHLTRVMIRGEISNFKQHYASGHFYFTLKDDRALLRAVMFKAHASTVRFTPQDGMAVVASGEISVYERDGQYQLYCSDMMPEGIGALALAFEQRKAKLEALGLFDSAHKKPLPAFARRIAVITSKTGAALEDIRTVVARRFPAVELVLCPVPVQGEDAPAMIAAAIVHINTFGAADVILLARGGGSFEDLFAFNDERIAYAIYESDIPVISAIGHETDFTIADFVADLRAPTPSAGAELAVPDVAAVLDALSSIADRMQRAAEQSLQQSTLRLTAAANALSAQHPGAQMRTHSERLNQLTLKLNTAASAAVLQYRQRIGIQTELLDSLSPLRVLRRGYALALRDGNVVKSTAQLLKGDRLTLRLQDGMVDIEIV